MLMLALWGNGVYGRAPDAVRRVFAAFISCGKAGKNGTLQPLDVRQEETMREVKRSGALRDRSAAVGRR